jgi:hypothetical protein
MKRILAILTATAFVAVLGGASMTQPAHSESGSKSQQTKKKAGKTKKASKKSAKRGAKQAEQPTSPHAAFQFNVLEPLAMASTCQDQGHKRGLSGDQYWSFVNACMTRRDRR